MRTFELPHSIEIIGAQVRDSLEYIHPAGNFSFTESNSPGSIVFVLEHDEIGNVGKIKLNERPDNKCNLIFLRPQSLDYVFILCSG